MKGMKKILTLVLSLFMAFSLCMTVCANDGDSVEWKEITNTTDSLSDGQLLKALGSSSPVYIKLMEDVSVEWGGYYPISGGKTVTIDLNGHNISTNSKTFFLVQNGKLVLTNSGNSGTISSEEVVVHVTGSTDSSASDYSTLIVDEKVTVKGYTCIEINYSDENYKNAEYGINVVVDGKLNAIKDSEGHSGTGVLVSSSFTALEGNVPKITLGEHSEITSQAVGIDPAGYAIWNLAGTIKNDSESTYFSALPLQNGTFNITDGYYYSNCESKDPAKGPNGNNKISGAAICLTSAEDTTTGTEKLVVNISGGEFVSENGYALLECISESTTGTALYANNKDAKTSYANLTITGGTFKGKLGAVKLNDMSDKQVISGGEFSSEVSRYLKNEYNIYVNADNLYEAVEKGQAAKSINQNNKVTSSLDYENIYEGIEDMFSLNATDYIILDAEEVTNLTKEDKDAVIKEIIKAESSKISADDIDYILPLDIKLGVNNYTSEVVKQLDTPITLYLNEATLKELSGKNVKVVRFDKDKEADDDNYFLNVVDTSLKENGLTFDAFTFSTKYVIVAYDEPTSPVINHVVTCEEEMNSKNWIWSETKKACVYKVSNTSAK